MRLINRRAIPLCALALLPLTACGDEAESDVAASPSGDERSHEELVVGPGVDQESKTIKVAAISALSGPADVIGVPLTAGQRVFFAAVNDGGGIDGWKIELIESDSQYNPQLHKQLYDEVRDDVALVSQSVGSPTTAAILDDVMANDVTVLPVSLALSLCRIPNMVPFGTPYQLDVMNGFQWLVDDRGAKEGDKTAIVYQDDEYGQDVLEGYEQATEELALDDVGQLTFARTDTDFSALLESLKDSDAEFVQVAATPSQTGPILAQAHQMGYAPTWLLSGPSWDESLLTRAGIDAEAFADAYVLTSTSAWGEAGVPGMDQMLADSERFTPDQAPSTFFLMGYGQGKIATEILRTAIESKDLSRAGILAAAAQLEQVDMGGLLPDLSVTAEDRIPARETWIFGIEPEAPSSVERVAEVTSPQAEAVSCE